MANGTELGKAYVQIVPSAEGITGSITNVLGGEASKAGETAGRNIMGKIKAAIAAAGIGKLLKDALLEGGALQQSIGGVETLYGDAANAIKGYAAEAYKYGLSTNEYMEQSTSFAAALRDSLGGDVTAAAQAANIALEDMADNSAKMGTDMASIQNAYQGFAKQNYTMLDNLKLGYGGTKTEMERLLQDAEKISGVKYDINNLSDVYSAIHTIQGELKLTGVASDEAKTTLTGSLGAMKAAAKNALGALTLGDDMGPALDNLMTTLSTFLTGNLLPMLGNIAKALPSTIWTLVSSLVPQLMKEGTNMIKGLAEGVKTGLPQLIHEALPMLVEFTGQFRENFGLLVDAGIELLMSLAQGLVEALPDLIAQVPLIVSNIANCINDNAPKLLKTAWNLIVTLVKGLIDSIPVILQNMPKIIAAIWDTITAVNWLNLGSQIIKLLGNGIKGMVGLAKDAMHSIAEGLKAKIKGLPADFASIGKNLIKGIWEGIKNMKDWLFGQVKGVFTGLVGTAKKALGIHSPSRVFAGIGGYMAEGLGNGWNDEYKTVERGITGDLADSVNKSKIAMAGAMAEVQKSTAGFDGSVTVKYQKESTDALLEALKSMKVVLDSGEVIGFVDAGLNFRSIMAARGV